MEKEQKYTNRLIHETSPYLLQHAHNPVDWYPWGDEVLARAKKEDKPILLSIGYSSCHWCHVMENESFENEAIAKIMNERFVNIKVDREERPDLDELYMNAVQVMTGSGGWPMTVFLTPDLVPFHAGTYFPPEDRGGMPGFPKILVVVSDYYRNHREEVGKMETQMKNALHQMVEIIPSQETIDEKILAKAFETFESQFDSNYGGFGKAPKFPSSMALSFLLRYWKRTDSKEALRMVEVSLEKMADGGIYDHLGGGFHRYSVDERWLIPHFEKMLYDNALLSRTYFEAYQATGEERYRRIAEEVLNYVIREMTSPGGGFYSTQDADSEGGEGKFYVWSRDQIKEVLGKEKGTPFCAYYGVTPQGNFEREASVLNIASTMEKISELYGISIPELEEVLEEGRKKLFGEREKRVRPGRDEKILTSWNGLMISSFVDGFKVTENEKYIEEAKKAARFILEEMRKDGHLMRVFHQGKSHVKGYSEDYAFFIQALIDLYEATFEIDWLKEADDLNRRMIHQFWDERSGGFFFTGKENEPLITQSKNPYDNVIPSSNSVALFNLIRLGYLTGEETLKQKAEQIIRLFYKFLSEHPSGFTHMLSGLSFFLDPEEIGIIGSKNDLRTKSMLQEIYRAYLPNKILSLKDPQKPIEGSWFPFLMEKGVTQVPTAFVCKKFTCLPPVKDEKELKKILE
ncbi:MAG: thioredoxin domain-containing protein [Desulfobacterales bacterium]|nr:thioredoxin domain-containing protein [Desulfobacterales bacterium]